LLTNQQPRQLLLMRLSKAGIVPPATETGQKFCPPQQARLQNRPIGILGVPDEDLAIDRPCDFDAVSAAGRLALPPLQGYLFQVRHLRLLQPGADGFRRGAQPPYPDSPSAYVINCSNLTSTKRTSPAHSLTLLPADSTDTAVACYFVGLNCGRLGSSPLGY